MEKIVNWNLLQTFAIVAETGSLAQAARVLNSSQPTMSRHINVLQEEAGVMLFERTANGLALTETGKMLTSHVNKMLSESANFIRNAKLHSENPSGTVSITASLTYSEYVLPEVLTDFRRSEPTIDINLIASDELTNLLEREADIALRFVRPTQLDVIAKKVGDIEIGMFASKDYFVDKTAPAMPQDLFDHDIICMEDYDSIIKGFRDIGMEIARDFFSFKCNSSSVNWRMIQCGYGIGFCHLQRGLSDSNLVQLFPEYTLPTFPMYLVSHKELKTNKLVQTVFNYLSKTLSEKF